jgi:GNAT superfamily N-acetyltransferase
MAINLNENLPNKEEYYGLFNTTGWNSIYQASSEELELANKTSWLVISAYDGPKLVGFGRVVTDFVLHAMIYTMIILPDYQNRGIGTMILKRILSRCREKNIRDIQLFCAKGKRGFYEKNSFEARPIDAPGMQLRRDAKSETPAR